MTIYIISQIILTFWLALTYDLLEGRCIHDAINIFWGFFIIQQIDSMLPNISGTLCYRLMRHFFVLTTFWRHLWSITEQTHGNMEYIG